MKRLFVTSLCLVLSATHTLADNSSSEVKPITHVVELFTSQGCPACPEANKTVNGLSDDEGVLVLSYSVPYWDYKGWRDTLAASICKDRQAAYNQVTQGRQIYTPQFVINGHIKGRTLNTTLSSKAELSAGVTLARTDEGLTLSFNDTAHLAQKWVLIEYVPGPQSVNITGGANKGHVMTMTNAVTHSRPVLLSVATGQNVHEINYTPQADKAYAVLAHDPQTLEIIAAAITP